MTSRLHPIFLRITRHLRAQKNSEKMTESLAFRPAIG
jgi:hypothetical protein